MRFLTIILTILLTSLLLSCGAKKTVQTKKELITAEKKSEILVFKPEKKLIITAVGDLMLGTDFPSDQYLPENNGEDLLKEATPFFKGSDIVFGNLEGSLSDSTECLKACKDPKKCYAFRMPEKYAENLKSAGFNLLSIANNHINDFGKEGREDTINILTENNINFAGVESHPSATFTINGIRFGFCAFSPNNGVPDIRDIENARKRVEELSIISDIVIVSFHGGAEGTDNRNIKRETEFFYGEDRGNVFEFARQVIDSGADMVFGHGPHIPRAVELYRDRFIAYSLGNFCTYARFNLTGANGLTPIIKIVVDEKGKFISGKIIPLRQEYKKGPAPDKMKRAIKEIKELTETDFPETPLYISDEGSITRRPLSIRKINNKVIKRFNR